ncbi:uncharacterized protein LOC110433189 isoform X2 [Sorghum bicolor]|uniref:Uncharacterized protein n=1 Tax=Sorghum bicolor TaxID=4558 RepID=A0A1W0W290_SORBI|nr:uncharacterized protein LOC110433189 isoform X2 [Sorghum bicolor]OQU88504.1 hypothetical protein SORBI_3002G047100 [Sorghum bicolor]|eukprot:XP_021310654.1 uncharacterized protein LOC110433189 isoform X2 [Sorghum bicolor]
MWQAVPRHFNTYRHHAKQGELSKQLLNSSSYGVVAAFSVLKTISYLLMLFAVLISSQWSVVAAGVPCGANQPPGRARGQRLARLRGHQRRKVQQDEPKDLKCDQRRRCSKRNQKVRGFHFPDCSSEEGSCQVFEGDNQEDEPEEDEEVHSSDATIGSAAILVKSCNDPNMDQVVVLVMEEQSTKIQLLHNRRPEKN